MSFIKYNCNLYYKRRLRDLTQKKLAEKIGIKRHEISILEKGHKLPTSELLDKIINELNMKESDIYSDRELEIILDYKKE